MILITTDYDPIQNYQVGDILYWNMDTGILTTSTTGTQKTNAKIISAPSRTDPSLTFETYNNNFLDLDLRLEYKVRMKVYSVIMFRWGMEESHSYYLGSWDTVTMAESEARNEVVDRDGKYDGVVYETELNGGKKTNKAICTYRGIGFGDRIEGCHLEYSSVWNRILDAFKK